MGSGGFERTIGSRCACDRRESSSSAAWHGSGGEAMEVAFDRTAAPWAINRTATAVIGMAVLGALALAVVSRQAFPVVAPLVAIVLLAGSVVVHLYFSDGQQPVFDLGALT